MSASDQDPASLDLSGIHLPGCMAEDYCCTPHWNLQIPSHQDLAIPDYHKPEAVVGKFRSFQFGERDRLIVSRE